MNHPDSYRYRFLRNEYNQYRVQRRSKSFFRNLSLMWAWESLNYPMYVYNACWTFHEGTSHNTYERALKSLAEMKEKDLGDYNRYVKRNAWKTVTHGNSN